jgi:LPXTG-motif cell wall-anchored protein
MTTGTRILAGLAAVFVAAAAHAQGQMPQTTTQETKGAATVNTGQISGEVLYVEGNNLVVKMSTGEIRTFSNVPDSRKALVDGKEVGIRDLKPGTKLQATITTTTTPITVRTTTVGSGKVWYVMGNTVVLTLPDGKNRQYQVDPSYKFTVNGQPATASQLKKGMVVSAEKIVEEPSVEITTNTVVVGQAPPPPPAPAAPVAVAKAEPPPPPAAEPVKTLPKTGSPVPLLGLIGLACLGGSFVLRKLGR